MIKNANYTPNQKLKIGDLLYRQKGPIKHVGIYVGNDIVAHNSPDNNVEFINLKEFTKTKTLDVLYQNLTETEQNEVLRKIKEIMREDLKYNPIINNCEHFVTKVLKHKKHSEQLNSIVLGATVGYGFSILTKSENVIRNTILTTALSLVLTNMTRKYDTKIIE